MTDCPTLILIPADPKYRPSATRLNRVKLELPQLLSAGQTFTAWTSDVTQAVGLFKAESQGWTCPKCGGRGRLSSDEVTGFGEMLFVQPATAIRFSMPCCGARATLAALDFGSNIGFARFGIEIADRRKKLLPAQLTVIAERVGCPLKQILRPE